MIKKFFIANLILVAMLIGICYSQLHASDTRRSGREIKALAQIEWTEADIQKGRDVAFAQTINTIANQSPESLRDYLATHKFKRYPTTYNQAAQQKHYDTIVASVERAIKKSPNSVAANDLALEITQFVKTIDPHTVKKLDLDTRASELISLAQAAGGGPVATPPPAPAIINKNDPQLIKAIIQIMTTPLNFDNAFGEKNLTLQEFMEKLNHFITVTLRPEANKKLKKEKNSDYLSIVTLNDKWKNAKKTFAHRTLVKKTLEELNTIKQEFEDILHEVATSDLFIKDIEENKKSGVTNAKLHALWQTSKPINLGLNILFQEPEATIPFSEKDKETAQTIQETLKDINFETLELELKKTKRANKELLALLKTATAKAIKTVNENKEFQEFNNLEIRLKELKAKYEYELNDEAVRTKLISKTVGLPKDAQALTESVKTLSEDIAAWSKSENPKPQALLKIVRDIIRDEEEKLIAENLANEAQQFQADFMKEKIGQDKAFASTDQTIDDFAKTLNDFLNIVDKFQGKFTEEQKTNFNLLKNFYDKNIKEDFEQKAATIKTQAALNDLKISAENIRKLIKEETSLLNNLFKADDANKDKPQHRNKLLGDIWKAKVITEIDELLAWKIDFNNAFAYKEKLTIPEFMTKLKEYLSKFDNDAKTRMEKGSYKSWMPKIYDGLKIFYEIDWLRDFKNKYDNKSDITTLTEIEDLLKQLTAIKQTITDKTFDGVNIFGNNMEGLSVGWTYNGNLNNMSNYATPMKRWLIDRFTGPTNMPTEDGEKTQANAILHKINLDEVKNNLDTTTPIKTEIDTLITTATAADTTRTKKVKADYYYAELEGLENRFNTLKTEYDGDRINTPVLAENFKQRLETLSSHIADWSAITNEKPKKLKEALEAIPVIVQKIAEIETLLKNPVGYENAFGTTNMTITDFMKSLGVFVGQFTEEDKQYLSESPKKNLTALQERVNTYKDFSNKLVNLQEIDTIKKIETLSTTIKKLITDINGHVFKEYYAKVNNPLQTEPHTKNNLLKTIWTEIMIGRKITTIQNQLDEPVSFPNAFGKETLTVNQFMIKLGEFLKIFPTEIQKKMSKDQRRQLAIIHTFYTETWNKNLKTVLNKHLNKTTLVKTIEGAEALQKNLDTLLLQIGDENGEVGKFFRADNEAKNNPQSRNNLLSAMWTDASVAKKVIEIKALLETPINYSHHFGAANALNMNQFMNAFVTFLTSLDPKKIKAADFSVGTSVTVQGKQRTGAGKLQKNYQKLRKLENEWIAASSNLKKIETSDHTKKEILKLAATTLNQFQAIHKKITATMNKFFAGAVESNAYLVALVNASTKVTVTEALQKGGVTEAIKTLFEQQSAQPSVLLTEAKTFDPLAQDPKLTIESLNKPNVNFLEAFKKSQEGKLSTQQTSTPPPTVITKPTPEAKKDFFSMQPLPSRVSQPEEKPEVGIKLETQDAEIQKVETPQQQNMWSNFTSWLPKAPTGDEFSGTKIEVGLQNMQNPVKKDDIKPPTEKYQMKRRKDRRKLIKTPKPITPATPIKQADDVIPKPEPMTQFPNPFRFENDFIP
jgi:hypothetical protein